MERNGHTESPKYHSEDGDGKEGEKWRKEW